MIRRKAEMEKGTGRVTNGSTVAEVGPGHAVLTSSGEGHSIENVADASLDILATIPLS